MPRPRILVVDDDEALAKSYRSALRVAGFDAQIAGDGLAALEDLVREQHPELVVLELQMPQLDGQSIVKASGVLHKPITPADLVASARRHLH